MYKQIHSWVPTPVPEPKWRGMDPCPIEPEQLLGYEFLGCTLQEQDNGHMLVIHEFDDGTTPEGV